MTDNIETFNSLVGLMFDQLYRKFPVAVDLEEHEHEFAEALGVEVTELPRMAGFPDRANMQIGALEDGTHFSHFMYSAVKWLHAEGFILLDDQTSEWTLTSKSLSALNATPAGLQGTLGARIASASKDVASGAGKAAIGELVGTVIGAVARNLF